MSSLSDYLITEKWKPEHPDLLQLYSRSTPNGVKVSILLEETGLPYEAHAISFEKKDQKTDEFLSLNPNNKVPAIIDPNGPGNEPLALFDSSAIMIYLADKTGQLLPRNPAARYQAIQWLLFQASEMAPAFGQIGFFHKFAGREYADKRPLQRYVAESRRLLSVVENRLSTADWIMGHEYTVPDIAIFSWVRNLIEFYQAADLVGFGDFPRASQALQRFLARPAVQRGLQIPPRD